MEICVVVKTANNDCCNRYEFSLTAFETNLKPLYNPEEATKCTGYRWCNNTIEISNYRIID